MVLPLAGRPNFAVTSGRFNPIQCPFKLDYVVSQTGRVFRLLKRMTTVVTLVVVTIVPQL